MRESVSILHQDDHLIAVNKPAGMLLHRSDIDRHETRFLVQVLRNQLRQRVYPVHRLDKPTSGVVLFALDPATAGLLQEQFRQHVVIKHYLAVVRGYTEPSGIIDYALKTESVYRSPQPHERSSDTPLPARTAYRRLGTTELNIPVGRYDTARYSLLELTPETGRRHQLRRHMKHIFHPIVGDTTHGDGKHNQMFRDTLNCHRLLLQARSLTFHHPHSGLRLTLDAGSEPEFAETLIALNLPTDYQAAS